MECGQGGEGIRLARLANTICAPPSSVVLPHFLTPQVPRYGNRLYLQSHGSAGRNAVFFKSVLMHNVITDSTCVKFVGCNLKRSS